MGFIDFEISVIAAPKEISQAQAHAISKKIELNNWSAVQRSAYIIYLDHPIYIVKRILALIASEITLTAALRKSQNLKIPKYVLSISSSSPAPLH